MQLLPKFVFKKDHQLSALSRLQKGKTSNLWNRVDLVIWCGYLAPPWKSRSRVSSVQKPRRVSRTLPDRHMQRPALIPTTVIVVACLLGFSNQTMAQDVNWR